MSISSDIDNNIVYLYIDESQDDNKSNLYLCVSIILSQDKKKIESELTNIKNELESDPYLGIRPKSIKKLLHYYDDNDDVKTKMTDTIQMMFFKSYISRMKFDKSNYSSVYYSLLKSILKNQIIKYKDRTFIIRYEQNSKITQNQITSTINSVIDAIKNENKHIIKSDPIIEKVTKEDLLISIPDYTLGLFLTYITEKNKENTQEFKIRRFERIRSKLRLFIDLNTSTYYSSKKNKPFDLISS
jgi:hypothetical protein